MATEEAFTDLDVLEARCEDVLRSSVFRGYAIADSSYVSPLNLPETRALVAELRERRAADVQLALDIRTLLVRLEQIDPDARHALDGLAWTLWTTRILECDVPRLHEHADRLAPP